VTAAVSAVLRTALTAELSVPCGSARPICFSRKDAKPRRALTQTIAQQGNPADRLQLRLIFVL